MAKLDSFLEKIEQEEEEASKLGHSKFRAGIHEQFSDFPQKFAKEQISRLGKGEQLDVDTFAYAGEEHRIARLCPEPVEFLSDFDNISNSRTECIKKFEGMIPKFDTLNLDDINLSLEGEEKGMWYNSTSRFVNLRPGYEDEDPGNPGVVQMGDLAVHGVVVGRTGSGKSVFLNNLIFNMLDEYPPWELDLYLADFKKVELSRYLNEPRAKTPHVKAVAATSEIRYVISLIEHLVDCMRARQTFFMRLGEQKLSDFRNKYKIVLPRVVFLVDEFQQLFQEATGRESERIDELLLSIIKLGRATGFHLLFASQEMSGALSGKALANFKIRFALPCETEISSAILGNSAADSIDPGFVYVNTGNGDEKYNRIFKVPFINVDVEKPDQSIEEHPFYGPLIGLCEAQKATGFKPKIPKFYDEDYREDLKVLLNTLDAIKDIRTGVKGSQRYLDVITLGNGVVYSPKKNDIETFYLERGQKKNILAMSPRITDLAYVQKLLSVNLAASPMVYQHRVYSFDTMIRKTYDFTVDLKDAYKEYTNPDNLIEIKNTYDTRNTIYTAAIKSVSPGDFAAKYLQIYLMQLKSRTQDKAEQSKYDEEYKAYIDYWTNELDGLEDGDVLDYLSTIDTTGNIPYKDMTQRLKMYVEIKAGRQPFSCMIYWICGIDNINDPPKWLPDILKNALELNMLFIILTSTYDDVKYVNTKVLPCCDYFFAGGNVERYYQRCGIPYTKKAEDSIVIDFKIRSLNTVRSFKMYRNVGFDETPAPSIDFDNIPSLSIDFDSVTQ